MTATEIAERLSNFTGSNSATPDPWTLRGSFPRCTKRMVQHTCATLLLQAKQPIHVVSERLGHTKVSMTMEVYAHVLPDMQEDAAATLGALLHDTVR